MNLLAGTYYDPAVSVNKVTTALLAMTALDTTNLRLTFTAPPSGRVRVVIRGGAIHGATTFPQILVGCVENSPSAGTVRGRQNPQGGGFNGTALATTQLPVAVDYIQTGLTPGQQYVWDAAYGVEILLAATGWKYGGPNDTTTNNAFGGVSFEIWDPSPIYTPSAGAPPTTPVSARIDTIDDFLDTEIAAIKAKTDNLPADPADASDVMAAAAAIQADTDNIQTRLPAALVGGRMDVSVGAMEAGVLTASALATDAGAEIADAVWDEAIAGHLAAGSTGLALNSAGAGGDPWSTALPGAYAAGTAGNIIGNRVDTAVSTRLASAGYTAPDNASVAAILVDTAAIDARLPSDPADQSVVIAATDAILAAVDTRLATAGYTAPDNAGITAIKAKTDSLAFTAAGYLDVNILKINGITVGGSGTEGVPWGPA